MLALALDIEVHPREESGTLKKGKNHLLDRLPPYGHPLNWVEVRKVLQSWTLPAGGPELLPLDLWPALPERSPVGCQPAGTPGGLLPVFHRGGL